MPQPGKQRDIAFKLKRDWRRVSWRTVQGVINESQVGGSWANAGTVTYDAKERKDRTNRCPVVLDRPMDTSRQFAGCDPQKILWVFNSYGGDGYCQSDHLITTPALEARLLVGVAGSTYRDAWDYHTALLSLPEEQSEVLFVGSTRPLNGSQDSKASSSFATANGRGYYTLLDASTAYDTKDLNRLQIEALLKAEQRLAQAQAVNTQSEGAIVVAFTTLLIAVFSIPQHWTPEIQRKLLRYPTKWFGNRFIGKTWLVCAYIGVMRFLASGVLVGRAIFSFVTVVARNTGTVIADGYPTISYYRTTWPPCNNARSGQPGFGVTEVAIVVTTMQTWAVALVCSMSVFAILIATVLAIFKAPSKIAELGDLTTNKDPDNI